VVSALAIVKRQEVERVECVICDNVWCRGVVFGFVKEILECQNNNQTKKVNASK
jgi:hypothetical protein